jgi:hypothetical protein
MQILNAGAARGHYGKPKLVNPERAMESTRNREAEIMTTDDTDERGSGIRGKCSLIFAYVRLCSLNWKKMFEASDGERSSILQNARQTEMGARVTRPSEHQRQRLARTNLDLGRARWLRENAGRMNGKANDLSDCNTYYIYDTGERGLGLEENLGLMGEKGLRTCAMLSLSLMWFQGSARLRIFVGRAPGGETGLCLWI